MNVVPFEKRIQGLEEKAKHGSGEPPYDGGMEARVAKLEVAIEYIQRDVAELKADVRSIRTTDFRLLFGAIITVALGLSALMAKGFHWL